MDFDIAEAKNDTPESDIAIPIDLNGDETELQIKQLIKEKLHEHFWWCSLKWQEKGHPLELMRLNLASGRTIELYNWFRPLSEQEIQDLSEAVNLFASIAEGKAIKSLGYILINNEQPVWTLETGDAVNGYGRITGRRDRYDGIQLFPNAFSGTHRAAKMSNFKGTVIHELTHHIAAIGGDLYNEWIDSFEWEAKDQASIDQRNNRCITDYAKTRPDEDFCDSMVAKVGSNPVLDSEKDKFLTERLFRQTVTNSEESLESIQSADPQLPELPKTLYYRQAPKIIIIEEEELLSE